MSTVRRSLVYTFAESYLGLGLQLVSTLFLARLLTPAETGVWAVAAVFAAVAGTFHDFGAQEYLIQEKELTARKLRAAMAANFVMSWTLAAVLLTASGWIAEFYREPGIALVMRVQAFNFILIPLGAMTFAWYRRRLDYRPFFIASTVSSTTSFVVAVSCAFAGLGYMSLAWSSLAGVVMSVSVSLALRPKELPLLPSFAGLREVLEFGKHATGIYVFGQVGKNAPELIIGRVLGMAPTAFFSRANGLTELFYRTVVRAALPVCLPYFAQEARRGADVRSGFLRAVAFLTVIAWPFFLFLGTMAFPAIRILYGTQWLASVPLAKLLCIAAAVEVIYLMAKDVLIANSDVRSANYLQAIVQCARLVGLFGVIPFGLVGACWGLVGASVVGALWAHTVLHRRIGLTLAQIARQCAPSLVIALVSAAPAVLWALFVGIDEHNFLVAFVVSGLLGAALWLAALRSMRHPLWTELDNLRLRLVARRARPAE